MPYIPQIDRNKFATVLFALDGQINVHGISNGELNYLFSMIAKAYLIRHGMSYNTLGDVVKALECAKLEFYRTVVGPYEDKKISQNGGLYHEGEF